MFYTLCIIHFDKDISFTFLSLVLDFDYILLLHGSKFGEIRCKQNCMGPASPVTPQLSKEIAHIIVGCTCQRYSLSGLSVAVLVIFQRNFPYFIRLESGFLTMRVNRHCTMLVQRHQRLHLTSTTQNLPHNRLPSAQHR